MGDSLATVTPQGNWWTPSCGEWTSNEIDLSPFNGEIISIRFVAINDYGNSFFMDNIQIFDKNPNSIRENDLNLYLPKSKYWQFHYSINRQFTFIYI